MPRTPSETSEMARPTARSKSSASPPSTPADLVLLPRGLRGHPLALARIGRQARADAFHRTADIADLVAPARGRDLDVEFAGRHPVERADQSAERTRHHARREQADQGQDAEHDRGRDHHPVPDRGDGGQRRLGVLDGDQAPGDAGRFRRAPGREALRAGATDLGELIGRSAARAAVTVSATAASRPAMPDRAAVVLLEPSTALETPRFTASGSSFAAGKETTSTPSSAASPMLRAA